jgi:hypothetical protein
MPKINAFLDTSAALQALSGSDPSGLFTSRMLDHVTYVYDDVVLSELLLAGTDPRQIEFLQENAKSVPSYLPVTGDSAEMRKKLRSSEVHSNDVLAMVSAEEAQCQYFITSEPRILEVQEIVTFQVVTPQQFISLVDGQT